MRTIHKYLIVLNDPDVMMPKRARLLSVAMRDGSLWLWALVNPKAPIVKHAFAVLGTGQYLEPMVEQGDFVGTVFDGRAVWHVISLGDIS